MKHPRCLRPMCVLLCLVMLAALLGAAPVYAASDIWEVSPTGYTQASDVPYVTQSGRIVNWGARGEAAVFLTSYAQAYYTGSYSYETLAANAGGTSQSNVTSSALYQALRAMVRAKQRTTTTYQGTRELYRYTDCMVNDYNHISSFYSGIRLNGAWDSGATWNREHTWPNSKANDNQDNDIMMLRPTSVQENSSRGNTAYGQSSGYYDPNAEANGRFNLRGDCARIMLYCYVRWDNQSYMWGQSGVMESMEVLLAWMEEDPVDTWEMGRNDAVQSITGVRNCFVDYPELAFLLFSREIPANYVTPSGSAVQDPCADGHQWDQGEIALAPGCDSEGVRTYHCLRCGESTTETLPPLGHLWDEGVVTLAPTTEAEGIMTYSCLRCGETRTEPIARLEPPFRFDDVRNESKYYFIPVYWAYEHQPQITKGTDETHFSPDKNCSRAEVVSFLWRTAGCPEPEGTASFSDVKAGSYYEKAACWAAEAGITQGTGGGRFSPHQPCTRAQVVSFLWRAMGKPVPTASAQSFSDVKAGAYYETAVQWAVEAGITYGTGGGRFSPHQVCTRAQIVTFLWRAFAG